MINMKDLIKKQTDMIRKESGMNLVTEKKELDQKYVKKVAMMTQRNNHTEARLFLSTMISNKRLLKFYKAMRELNDVFRGYPAPLSKVMSEMDKELYKQLLRKYSNYDEIYNTL